MKKVISLVLVLTLAMCSASFAAKAPAKLKMLPTPTAGTGTLSDINSLWAKASSPLSVGFFGGTPTVKYNFTRDFSGEMGINLTSTAGVSAFNILFAGSNSMYKVGINDVTLGGMFSYTSGAGATTTQIGLTFSAKTRLNSTVELEFVIVPIQYASNSVFGTTTGILNNAFIAAHIYI